MSTAPPENPNDESTPPSRRRYSEDFKRDVVRLITEDGYSVPAAAKACGASVHSVRNWYSKLAPAPEPVGEDATVDELRSENQRLRKQLRKAELERAILEKATAYFTPCKTGTPDQQRSTPGSTSIASSSPWPTCVA